MPLRIISITSMEFPVLLKRPLEKEGPALRCAKWGAPSQFELPYVYSNANASAVQQADFGLVLTSSEAYMSAVALQHCKSPTSLEMWMVYYSGYYPWLLDTLVHEWLKHTDEAYVCWLSIWPVSSIVSSTARWW